MRDLFRLFMVMVMSQILLASCTEVAEALNPTDDPLEESLEGEVSFGASISSLQSKATESSFDSGDQISVTAYLSDEIYASNALYTYAGNVFTSEAPINLPEDGSSLSYRAVYPYTEMSDGVVEFSIKQDQSGTNYTASDLMSSALNATVQSSPSLTFEHVLSSVVVNITSEVTLVDVDATIESAEGLAYNMLDNSIEALGNTVSVSMNENGTYSYKAIVVPASYSAGDAIATIYVAGVEYVINTPESVTYESGYQYTFNLTIAYGSSDNSDLEVKFTDLLISDWGEGFTFNWTTTFATIESSMASLYDALVAVQLYTTSHFDFSYPSLMIAYDTMAANMISTTGDSNSGYDWFSPYLNGSAVSPDTTRSAFIWYCYERYISYTNRIIYLAGLSGDTSTEMMSYVAAAKSMRAMFYLDLARLYEPLANDYTNISGVEGFTVPYIGEDTTDEEKANNPRLTRDELFEKIFADLDDVEYLYLDGGVSPLSARVPNLAVVYGFKARAYLWLGGFDSSNYESAATYARKAIDTSGASIMSESQYCDILSGFNTPNSSWMLYMNQLELNMSNLCNYLAWMSSEVTDTYGILLAEGVSSARYDRMSDTDFRKRLFLSGTPQYSDYADISLRSSDDFSWASPYSTIKFRPFLGELNNFLIGNATSIPLMRVEEMYFIEAEAIAHNSASEGASLLNSFMSYRDSAYSFSSSDSAAVVDEIVFQKSVELWGEGIYLFDAKRLGLGIYLNYDGSNAATASQFNIDGVAPWWNLVFPTYAVEDNSALEGMNNPDPSEVYSTL